VTPAQRLFFNFQETFVVATIELLEAAAGAGRNGEAGVGGEIVVGEDAVRFGGSFFWGSRIRRGICVIFFRGILSRLRLRGRRAGGLRDASLGARRSEKKNERDDSRKNAARMKGGARI